jgi:hypothetical protein
LPYWELIYQERGEDKRLSLPAFGGPAHTGGGGS